MLEQYRDVFKSLNAHEVKYLVIGGIAMAVHAIGRTTFDLDIVIQPTPENARRALTALDEAGLHTAGLTTPGDLLAHEITILRDYVQVDIQTKTPGIDFEKAWARREEREFRGIRFNVVSREDLIASKKAAGRDVDLRDLEALGEEMQDSDGSPPDA